MQQSGLDYNRLLKLMLIGNSGVGKSCLLMRYTDNTFTQAFYNTIGVDFKTKTIELDGKSIKVQVWDTAGQDRFKTITASYYKGANGILIVYDVTDRESFNNLKYWLSEIEKNANQNTAVILVGNKVDMVEKRQVTYDEGYNFAKTHNLPYIQTSAMNATNTDLVFQTVCRNVIQRQPNVDARKSANIAGSQKQNHSTSSCC